MKLTKKPTRSSNYESAMRKDDMQTKIIRIHAPRRNPRHPVRGYSQPALDALTLKSLAELVVDVMEERGAIPTRQSLEAKP